MKQLAIMIKISVINLIIYTALGIIFTGASAIVIGLKGLWGIVFMIPVVFIAWLIYCEEKKLNDYLISI